MNHVKRSQFLSAAFSVAIAFVQLAGAQADSTKTVRVQFKRGATAATYKGVVRGYDTVDYVLRAGEGQRLSVNLASANRFLYFNVLDRATMAALETDPPPTEVTRWDGTLPKAGDYVVRVYLVRAEARRKGSAPFSLTVGATGAGSGGAAAAVGSPARNYKCESGAELSATFTLPNSQDDGSARLKLGGTVWSLRHVPSGSGAKYSDGKITFWTKGNEAIFERDGRSENCTLQN